MAHYYIYFEFRGIFVVFLAATLAAIAVRDMYVKDTLLATPSHMTQAWPKTAAEAAILVLAWHNQTCKIWDKNIVWS